MNRYCEVQRFKPIFPNGIGDTLSSARLLKLNIGQIRPAFLIPKIFAEKWRAKKKDTFSELLLAGLTAKRSIVAAVID